MSLLIWPRCLRTRLSRARLFASAWLAGGLVAALPAPADTLIGQTTAVSGTVAASVGEALQGVHAYVDHVNAQGGVHGEQVKLITLDDNFKPVTKGGRYLDPEAAAASIEAVKNQGKK